MAESVRRSAMRCLTARVPQLDVYSRMAFSSGRVFRSRAPAPKVATARIPKRERWQAAPLAQARSSEMA